jgi:hypothetical protein
MPVDQVPKGREAREERVFFLVGTDWPARQGQAALDHLVSPVSGIGPAGLESSVPRTVYKLYTAHAVLEPATLQSFSLSHRDLR